MARPGLTVDVKVTVFAGPLQRYSSKVQAGSEKAVRATGQWLVGDIVRSLETPGRGRMYGSHRASAPGQPPARRYGALANSIDFRYNGLMGRLMARGPSGIVYSSSEYAPHLEYGTVHMAPRPFMRPAARRAKMILEAAMKDVVRFS